MKKIVSQESLDELINRGDDVSVRAIGRALVALFNRQIEDEKRANTTRVHNMEGFTPGDARSGSLTAKYFLKHQTLLQWQVEMWTKRNDRGRCRLVKYHRQLNEIANKKAG